MSPSVHVPGYWMNETSGVLAPAIEAYLTTTEELNPLHIAAIRAYFRQWMAGDWRGARVDELRDRVNGIRTRADIDAWLEMADEEGIDPL